MSSAVRSQPLSSIIVVASVLVGTKRLVTGSPWFEIKRLAGTGEFHSDNALNEIFILSMVGESDHGCVVLVKHAGEH